MAADAIKVLIADDDSLFRESLRALTGDSDAGLHQAARDSGTDAVLQKHELARVLVQRLTAGRTIV